MAELLDRDHLLYPLGPCSSFLRVEQGGHASRLVWHYCCGCTGSLHVLGTFAGNIAMGFLSSEDETN